VKVIDHGWDRIVDDMLKLKSGLVASVGIQGAEAQEVDDIAHGDVSNAFLGAIHEFGAGHVPERSWLRSTFDNMQSNYQRDLDRIAGVFFDRGHIQGELFVLGEEFRSDIIDTIRGGIPPGLKEESLKGRPGEGSTPLWATGQMVNSITSVVEDRRSVE
jgi:hypothetical protein